MKNNYYVEGGKKFSKMLNTTAFFKQIEFEIMDLFQQSKFSLVKDKQ